ncbi:MAG TPA: hypothetical protein PLV92_03680, partial [Pirellulaceae bacterium]|nr:hypothetical protein [Pirellulaceae bacterium]
GECQPGEEADVEMTCWASDADLLEVVSGWRFQRSDVESPFPSVELTQRLLDPQPTPPPIATPPAPLTAPALHTSRPSFRAHSIVVAAAVVAAAVVMIAGFIGGLRWFGRIGGEGRFPVVRHDDPKGRSPDETPSQPGTERAIDGAVERPDVKQIANDPSRASNARPNDASPDRDDAPKPDRPASIDPQRAKPESIVDSPRRPVTPIGPNDGGGTNKSVGEPKQVVVRPQPATTTLAQLDLNTPVGIVLVKSDASETWRVGRGKIEFDRPLRLASASESWTQAEVPGLGTLVLAGESAVTVVRGGDRIFDIHVERGQAGLRDFPAGVEVRFSTVEAKWTTRGVHGYSNLAVVRDWDAPQMFVSTGLVTVASQQIAGDQLTTLSNGLPTPPTSLATRRSSHAGDIGTGTKSSATSSSFQPISAIDPYDARWMSPPDERTKREWQAQNGKLVARLAEADDVVAELKKLRASTAAARQTALLARWSLAVATDRPASLWEMLNDRQEAVREAAVACLREMHPREERFREAAQFIRRQTSDGSAELIVEWMVRVRRSEATGQPLPLSQATELIDGLNHEQLAVRQIAATILELQTADAFRSAKRKPPTFAADSPIAKRVAAQVQWRALSGQLFPSPPRRARPGN